MSIVFKDLSDERDDRDLLSRFYDDLYVAGFPDPDERESLANMERYLELRRHGWYGPNSYHIILALDGERTVAASVSDYLASPNCGIIEFLVVDESMRGTGVGKKLHAATIEALHADARRAGHDGIDAVVIELNDPFQVAPADDNYDPFERAMIWDRWGYGRLCFPYVQPALSADQQPATCLLLAVKPIAARLEQEVPPDLVIEILRGYLRWAMRIEDPDADPIFMQMQRFLAAAPAIRIEPLAVYVGRDPERPVTVVPVENDRDPNFRRAVELYTKAFPPGPTVIDTEMFRSALQWFADRDDVHYHLWALANAPHEQPFGMTSFFVMPRFGFGGYLAFDESMRGGGRARIVIKRVEEQIIRDASGARVHYIECAPHSTEESIFCSLGFQPVPMRYIQPATVDEEHFGSEGGPEITLLQKTLGSDDGRSAFDPDRLLEDLKVWLTEVYRIAHPESSETFRVARSTIGRERQC
jgi:GNAT superfamily N-acetyltransferase